MDAADPARNRKGGRAESREEEGREKKEKVPLFHLVDKEKSSGGKGGRGKKAEEGRGRYPGAHLSMTRTHR